MLKAPTAPINETTQGCQIVKHTVRQTFFWLSQASTYVLRVRLAHRLPLALWLVTVRHDQLVTQHAKASQPAMTKYYHVTIVFLAGFYDKIVVHQLQPFKSQVVPPSLALQLFDQCGQQVRRLPSHTTVAEFRRQSSLLHA